MVNKFFMYLLIILIASQSIDAMADAIQYHQPNSPYTEKDYFPAQTIDTCVDSSTATHVEKPTNNTTKKMADDHCCYCHGVNCYDLQDRSIHFVFNKYSERSTFTHPHYLTITLSPNLRPPMS